IVFALPAARAPPASVTSRILTDGSPRSASSMVGIVVTRSSSMILGLVSANNEDATAFTLRRPVTGSAGRVPAETSGTLWSSALVLGRHETGDRAGVHGRRHGRPGRRGGLRRGGGRRRAQLQLVPVAGHQVRLGVQDIQGPGHGDEQEHGERERENRGAVGPVAARGCYYSRHSSLLL